MGTETKTAVGFRDYLRVVVRRRYTIVLIVVLFVGPAVSVSLLQSPVYAAKSRVLLQALTPESLVNANSGTPTDPARTLHTQLEVFAGEPLRGAVKTKLGSIPSISAKGVGETDVIEITAHDGGAKTAATIADAYADAYVALRRTQAVDNLVAAGQQVQTRLTEAQKRLDDLEAQIAAAPPDRQAALRQSPDRDALVAQVAILRQKIDNLQIDQGLNSGGAEIVTHARIPTNPVSPRPFRTGLLAFAVGLVVGTGIAFLLEYLDDSVKTRDELSRLTGRPVLGVIPVVVDQAESADPVVSLKDPHSPAAEAYRSLRTSIQFLALDTPVVTIEVTSPSPREGKTTTVANLGVAMARAGQRVVIVGCDLRRPIVHEFFGLDGTLGLTSVILGKAPLSSVVQAVHGQNRLSVLPSGPLPPNPAEILSSWRFAEVLTSLQQNADVVLLDAPPVLPVTDAMVLSGRVDATVLVALSGVSTRQEVTRAFELLTQVGAPVVGTVLNGVSESSEYGYGYDYYRSSDQRGNADAPH
ncbi:MAG: polysaccharide biosynthesis tyrosine autokinase [Actinomycetota bacterium]|nr:polysaccharide biosynthesis tyrosine autokinase [Actinomycetota bacterium]